MLLRAHNFIMLDNIMIYFSFQVHERMVHCIHIIRLLWKAKKTARKWEVHIFISHHLTTFPMWSEYLNISPNWRFSLIIMIYSNVFYSNPNAQTFLFIHLKLLKCFDKSFHFMFAFEVLPFHVRNVFPAYNWIMTQITLFFGEFKKVKPVDSSIDTTT